VRTSVPIGSHSEPCIFPSLELRDLILNQGRGRNHPIIYESGPVAEHESKFYFWRGLWSGHQGKGQSRMNNTIANRTVMTRAAHVKAIAVIAALGLFSFAIQSACAAGDIPQYADISLNPAIIAGAEKAKVSDADLAKDLQNPVADIISVPLENRLDNGPANTWRYTLNVQPVIPFEISKDWLVVSRTILPIIYASEPVGGEPALDNVSFSAVGSGPSVGGIGDVTQSFFFAPKKPTDGWIWGVGPVFRLPTASRSSFGDGKWGAGPTAVVLRQEGAWTYGILASHIWSFAGWGPEDVSITSLQPFLAYTTDSLTTFGVGTESGYDWVGQQWVVPIDLTVSQLVRIGEMPVEFGVGARVYAERPDGGPNWGLKFTVTFLLPN
jgi:hypothetical protein